MLFVSLEICSRHEKPEIELKLTMNGSILHSQLKERWGKGERGKENISQIGK